MAVKAKIRKVEQSEALVEVLETAPTPEQMAVSIAEERKVVLRGKAEEVVAKLAKDLNNQDLVDELLDLGKDTQISVSSFLDQKMAAINDGTFVDNYPEAAKNLTELRVRLEEIDPHEFETKALSWLISWIPFIRRKFEATALTRIKSGFGTYRQNIKAVEGHLKADRVRIIEDVKQFDGIDKQLVERLLKIKENEELGDILLELLTQVYQSSALPDVKSRWQEILAQFSIRLQDLYEMEQLYLQGRVTFRIMRNANRALSESIFRTTTTGINALMMALTIESALESQRKAALADRETRRYIGSTVLRNAKRLNQAAEEIGKMSIETVVDLETLEATKSEIMQAVDTMIRYREMAISQAKETIPRLRKMNEELRNKAIPEPGPQEAPRYGLDADHF